PALALESAVEEGVEVALVEDEHAVVLAHGVELGQGLAPVAFRGQARERVTQADERGEVAVDVAVQVPPVGVHHAQDVAAERPAVLERLPQHLAASVDADGLEALLQEPDRMEPGAGGDVEDLLDASCSELVDEEAAFALVAP